MFIADKHPLFYEETATSMLKQIGNVLVHYEPSTKFKTISIAVKFITAFRAENLNERSLIPEMLMGGTKKLMTSPLVQQELSGLYGAEINTSTQKIGLQSVIAFDMTLINEKYLPGNPKLLPKACQLLSEVIYQPRRFRNSLRKLLFLQEKRMLAEELTSEYHDRFSYGYTRFKQLMFAEELFRLSPRGELVSLPDTTLESVNAAYLDMIANDQVVIFAVGDFAEEEMDRLIADHFASGTDTFPSEWLDRETKAELHPAMVTEYGDLNQARIYMGFRTPINSADRGHHAMLLYNVILGDSDQAKLFLEIREKHNLSYDISSTYIANKGVVFVFAGTDVGKEEDLIDKISGVIANFKGSLTEEDLSLAKETAKKRILQGADSADFIINRTFYNYALFRKKYSLEEHLNSIEAVTMADIFAAADSLELDTTFVYTRKEGHQDE